MPALMRPAVLILSSTSECGIDYFPCGVGALNSPVPEDDEGDKNIGADNNSEHVNDGRCVVANQTGLSHAFC
jgi:hypothetical protein